MGACGSRVKGGGAIPPMPIAPLACIGCYLPCRHVRLQVGRIKRKPVYVLGTAKRPIPLNHFLYSDHTMSLLMDGAAVDVGDNYGWKTANYKAASAKLELRLEKKGGAGSFGPQRNFRAGNSGGGTDKGQKQVWSNLINTLTTKDLLPSIIFCFSKKKCEECAFFGLSSVDLNTAKEKAAVHLFIDAAVRRLSGTDRTLPQIMRLRSLLRRGIGVHHSGLLPIMKETVELLFARGLVKVRDAMELVLTCALCGMRAPHFSFSCDR